MIPIDTVVLTAAPSSHSILARDLLGFSAFAAAIIVLSPRMEESPRWFSI